MVMIQLCASLMLIDDQDKNVSEGLYRTKFKPYVIRLTFRKQEVWAHDFPAFI